MPEFTTPDRIALPWFIERMWNDSFQFGLKLSNGETLGIARIVDVRRLGKDIWLDVELLDDDAGNRGLVVAQQEGRTRASVNARHILYSIDFGG